MVRSWKGVDGLPRFQALLRAVSGGRAGRSVRSVRSVRSALFFFSSGYVHVTYTYMYT